jgi:hypothetical protein
MHARAPVQPVNNEFMLPPTRMHGNTTARTKPDGIRGQMLDLLLRGLGPEAVPVIEVHVRPTDPMRERIAQYLSRFNELKQGPPVLLKQTGAHLAYAFRGDTVSRPVDVIGVPSYDAVVYIAAASGRVAMTGERTGELARLLMRVQTDGPIQTSIP